uniref:Uncharacterized protein n=1 Tax=viral metagenome TaxID=1070528 RepID=A0A6C0L7P4_9ZZZZ
MGTVKFSKKRGGRKRSNKKFFSKGFKKINRNLKRNKTAKKYRGGVFMVDFQQGISRGLFDEAWFGWIAKETTITEVVSKVVEKKWFGFVVGNETVQETVAKKIINLEPRTLQELLKSGAEKLYSVLGIVGTASKEHPIIAAVVAITVIALGGALVYMKRNRDAAKALLDAEDKLEKLANENSVLVLICMGSDVKEKTHLYICVRLAIGSLLLYTLDYVNPDPNIKNRDFRESYEFTTQGKEDKVKMSRWLKGVLETELEGEKKIENQVKLTCCVTEKSGGRVDIFTVSQRQQIKNVNELHFYYPKQTFLGVEKKEDTSNQNNLSVLTNLTTEATCNLTICPAPDPDTNTIFKDEEVLDIRFTSDVKKLPRITSENDCYDKIIVDTGKNLRELDVLCKGFQKTVAPLIEEKKDPKSGFPETDIMTMMSLSGVSREDAINYLKKAKPAGDILNALSLVR